MSSPPPYQTPTNPLKRPSISSSVSQPLGKKQRMHPLRQTSFPTGLDTADRSFGVASDAGSVTGSFTGSIGGASADGIFAGAARGKKRGRKSKAEKEREREQEDALSSRAGDARFGSADAEGSMRGGMGGGAGGGDDVDYDDDDDEGELLGREEGTTDTEAEKKNLAILVDAFNPQQSERYDLFKRAKLRKESLRRIVNHALSQSVPASVVTTVNGFTKVFAGEVIEKARTVQAEWADAFDQAARTAFEAEEAAAEKAFQARAQATAVQPKTTTPTPSSTPVPGSGSRSLSNGIKKEPSDTDHTKPSSTPANNLHSTASPAPAKHIPPSPSLQQTGQASTSSPAPLRPRREFRPPPNPHRGQLLPSHLREAIRRSKRDGEGGGVGFSGLSMDNLGVKGSVTWSSGSVGGRRLFR
ncbi:uncharacterized protein N7482_002683 [Penicillium canariense]|uniref:TAFII28-like protein domain-containing protein n=1 Tax=Penicillium canariense TaxID=189055 RepID=A0A9W9IJF7_9EURO|nr:uncharacterized protein N7482_002683 [Penicillium canariense]KAJ5176806.1 hypothetical protein N7482_002683 [Penicillium canariense]